jgi:hypothetical protein
MIDEIYRAKQHDRYLTFDELLDGLSVQLIEMFEETFPGQGREFAVHLLTPGAIGDVDWGEDAGAVILRGDRPGDIAKIVDPTLAGLVSFVCGLLQFRAWYLAGDIDKAWRHVVGFSQLLANLRTQWRVLQAQARFAPGAGEAEIKSLLAVYGAAGAAKKNEPLRELKRWAIDEAGKMRGADADIARKLSARIPARFADLSKNPSRFIYETLRAARDKPKPS